MLASPNIEAKSQCLNLKKLIKIWLIIIKVGSWILCQKINKSRGTCIESFGSTITLCSTQHLTQVPNLTSKECCHVRVYVMIGTWDHVQSGKSQFPCSQWLRLHGLSSSDLGAHVNRLLRATSQMFTNEARAVTMRLWKPKIKCSKAIPMTPPKSYSVVTDPQV